MGMWDRLGNVIKSYLNDDVNTSGRRSASRPSANSNDPDLDAAFDELNDYLNTDKADNSGSSAGQSAPAAPEELRPDFAELGVPFGASAEECKSAYKKLLKIHHPDRHAGHAGNFQKATERTARINAAYDRIEKWRAGG